jgi:uncharacterized protein YodC (DUF2158 family)
VTVLKSGDLVMLKSGGPVMTVDTVNTDIFDDDKITGILCAWFVGDKLERARFDHAALAPASSQGNALGRAEPVSEEVGGEYKIVLDEMMVAMNDSADAPRTPRVLTEGATTKGAASQKTKRAPFAKTEMDACGPPAAAPTD